MTALTLIWMGCDEVCSLVGPRPNCFGDKLESVPECKKPSLHAAVRDSHPGHVQGATCVRPNGGPGN